MEGVDTSVTNTSNRKLYGITIVPCNLGDVVLVKGEKIIGVVSYKGTVEWDPKTQYIGLTLSDPVKNGHNGTVRGYRFFSCPDKHGLLIASHLVSRKIHGSELLHKVTSLNHAFKQCYKQSQDLQRKYLLLRETLHRVDGDNQRLRQRLQYYEQGHTGPITNSNHNHTYITETSPSPAPPPPNRALTPSPSSRSRSKSAQKRRTFQKPLKPLPPLPPNKVTKSMPPSPQLTSRMTAEHEEDPTCYGLPTPLTISANAPKIHKNRSTRKKQKKKRRRVYRRRSNSNDTMSYKSRKSSYKSRKSSYKSRKSSYKSRTTKTISFKSRTTMTSTRTRTADRLVHDSPMPLSIGDNMGGTIKMLIPNHAPVMNRSYSANTLDILNDTDLDESECHDYHDNHDTNTNYTRTNTNYTSHFDDAENELFSPTNDTHASHTGHYGQRVKFIDDNERLSVLFNVEEGSLELGSCASTNMLQINEMDNMILGDDMKVPQIINEDNEVEIEKHLVPHIVEEEYTSISDSESDGDIVNVNMDMDDNLSDYEHMMDEDSDLEIETPVLHVQAIDMDVGIPMYQPQHKLSIIEPELEKEPVQQNINAIPNTYETKPLPPLVATQSKHSTNSSNKNTMTVHSIQYSGSVMSTDVSIPDNIGLYATATASGDNRSSIRLLSDTQSSARYSNAPSYTYSNLSKRTSNTISPQKKPTHRKRLSHTGAPAAINTHKFNPMKKFSSVPAQHTGILMDHDTDNGVFAARDILNNMHTSSDDNTSNNSKTRSLMSTPNNCNNIHVRYGQNDNGNFHNITKRKSIGAIKNHKKMKKKKRVIRSRTFVTNTHGQKYNVLETAKQLDESTMIHQRECTPEIDFVEQKSYHPMSAQNTPLTVPTTPQTMPLHAHNVINNMKQSHSALTLDDFALDHQLDQRPHGQHQKYYSTRINLPGGTPVITTAKSEQFGNDVFYRKPRSFTFTGTGIEKKNNLSEINTQYSNAMKKSKGKKTENINSPHRNLGSLTHNELKGLLEADNLFSYENYQKMVQ